MKSKPLINEKLILAAAVFSPAYFIAMQLAEKYNIPIGHFGAGRCRDGYDTCFNDAIVYFGLFPRLYDINQAGFRLSSYISDMFGSYAWWINSKIIYGSWGLDFPTVFICIRSTRKENPIAK